MRIASSQDADIACIYVFELIDGLLWRLGGESISVDTVVRNPDVYRVFEAAKAGGSPILLVCCETNAQEIIGQLIDNNGLSSHPLVRPEELERCLLQDYPGVPVYYYGCNKPVLTNQEAMNQISYCRCLSLTEQFGMLPHSAHFAVMTKQAGNDPALPMIQHLIAIHAADRGGASYWRHWGYRIFGAPCRLALEAAGTQNLTDWAIVLNWIQESFPSVMQSRFLSEVIYFALGRDDMLDNAQQQIMEASRCELQRGIRDFLEDSVAPGFLMPGKALAFSGLEYLNSALSPYDRMQLACIPATHGERVGFPIVPEDTLRFGIVYPWPGINSAETEINARLNRAAEDVGMECVMLTDFGFEMEKETQTQTDKRVIDHSLQFVLTSHYESHKSMDRFYYHFLWNPPEIPLGTDYYSGRVTDNYLMNDDYLIYDNGGMSNHLRSMLLNKPRDTHNALRFVGSFPKSACLEPQLSDPKLFYCGMNWERLKNSNRHEGLFKLLDDTGAVKFYGPDKVEAWGGIRPWEGYRSYQFSIPFDGFSILKEINQCGICLALSSDIHRRAGAVTNRVYEACAAGAVIISDNNEFMLQHFKDAVLFIDYNKNDPRHTFDQIMEKYNWIITHPDEALALARRSQEIFCRDFSMDGQLLNLVKQHPHRFQTIARDLFATEEPLVLVTYVLNTLDDDTALSRLSRVVENVENQYYRNILLAVACDHRMEAVVDRFLSGISSRAVTCPMELFDFAEARVLTDGQAICTLQKRFCHSYYINTTAHERWFYDHITTLVRTLQDDTSAQCAYAGCLSGDADEYRRAQSFGDLTETILYQMPYTWNCSPGQFMFVSHCQQMFPDYLFDCVDGLEHSMYAALLHFKYGKQIAFSRRMTYVCEFFNMDTRSNVLNENMQIKFIRGLIKYDVATALQTEGIGNEQVLELMTRIPIKAWLKIRYYQARLRSADTKTAKGKQLLQKYEQSLKTYFSIV